MALLLIDGFECYGTSSSISSDIALRYPGASTINMYIYEGRIGGYCAKQNFSKTLTTPALTQHPTLIAGHAIKFQDNSDSYASIIFRDNDVTGVKVTFNYLASNIEVYVGGVLIDTVTLTNSFEHDIWYYFEVKTYCHDTNGTIEVRINETTIISLTDINTKTGTDAFHNTILFSFNYIYIDDVYICDGSGTVVNDFQGVCRIIGLFPDADTDTAQWTPYTGSIHYNQINDNPDSVATYLSSAGQDLTDLFSYPSLTGINTIAGIQIATKGSNNTGSSAILQTPIVSNEVTDLGENKQVIGSTYVEVQRISMIDPNTDLPWTVDGLMAAQLGIRMM